MSVILSGRGFAGSAVLALLVIPVVDEIIVVSASAPRNARVGTVVTVNATVANYGSFQETFRIDLYANETLVVEASPIILQPQANYTTSLGWNTTGSSAGRYSLFVVVPPVPGELNVIDNRLQAGTVYLESSPGSKPAPTPSVPGNVIGLTYGRVLAITAALAETIIVFLVFLRKRKSPPTKMRGK